MRRVRYAHRLQPAFGAHSAPYACHLQRPEKSAITGTEWRFHGPLFSSRSLLDAPPVLPRSLRPPLRSAHPEILSLVRRRVRIEGLNTVFSSRARPQGIGPARLRRSEMLTHLQRLEAESIHIMREVVGECENPVMLYSIGKDSAVMLHLALKAFAPGRLPFPLLHVDTTWKFREMIAFRDETVERLGLDLRVHVNPEGLERNINPFSHGSAVHTDIWKTQGLKQALDHYGFDAAFGGARRDEEKSRAKERIFSIRSEQHRWDPKMQRPELWRLYNTRKRKGESLRVFPISNWTELDIWEYIHLNDIPIVPLYFAKERPVVSRDGTLIMVDDERMPLLPGEVPEMRKVRFRTLGCYPLTGAIESTAQSLPEIIQEMLLSRTSERQGRLIDSDSAGSMEKKKQEGYF
ncbi:sulfate adenylyltransferase subunit CysD [Pseudomonas sp. 2FE]|uniref:sulfate adenylyltransferase subunit CysD n=1 Tax=Pseudomonas sp. 2FE TaxID=2502190 RepID=UPI0021156D0E|nr:sulfate adenylyltransferase subunit CysD [Pseudomonas sp. 2FE]